MIDFGDMHLGHPALDLSVVWTVLPARARHEFFDVYGSVSAPGGGRRAAARAHLGGLAQEAYGRDVGDVEIQREGVLTLHSVVA